MKAAGEGLWFISLQSIFDAPGQTLGQQHCHPHCQQAQQHHLEDRDQRYMGQAAPIESDHHETDDLSRAVADRGIGRVLRAQGAGFVGGVGPRTGQGWVLGVPGVESPPQSGVRGVKERVF